MAAYRTEALMWAHLKTRLTGRWWRVEAVTPVGFLDVFGFYRGETHIIELKIGKPGIDKLRAAQYDMIVEALRQGGPVWCCFAHRGIIKWYRGLPFGDPCEPPPFYRPKPTSSSRRA